MDNKIIEVLDYLGQKIGLAIDWSAENIYPQLIDFMGRYKAYSIVEDVIWTLFCMGIVFAFVWFIKKLLIPDYKLCRDEKRDTKFYEWWSFREEVTMDVAGVLITSFGGIAAVIATAFIFINLQDIVRWIFIPEYQFYNIISGLI